MEPRFEGYNFAIKFRVLSQGSEFVTVALDKLVAPNGQEVEIERLEPLGSWSAWQFKSYTGSEIIDRNTALVVKSDLLYESIRRLLADASYKVHTPTGEFVVSRYRLGTE